MKALIKVDIPEAYIKVHGSNPQTFNKLHNLVKEYLNREVFIPCNKDVVWCISDIRDKTGIKEITHDELIKYNQENIHFLKDLNILFKDHCFKRRGEIVVQYSILNYILESDNFNLEEFLCLAEASTTDKRDWQYSKDVFINNYNKFMIEFNKFVEYISYNRKKEASNEQYCEVEHDKYKMTYDMKLLHSKYPIKGEINLIDLCNFASPRLITILYNITSLYTSPIHIIKDDRPINIRNIPHEQQQLILEFCNTFVWYNKVTVSSFNTMVHSFAKDCGLVSTITRKYYNKFMDLYMEFVKDVSEGRNKLKYNKIDLSILNLDDIDNCIYCMPANLKEMLFKCHKEYEISIDGLYHMSDFLKKNLSHNLKKFITNYKEIAYWLDGDKILYPISINGSFKNQANTEHYDYDTIIALSKFIENYVNVILPKLKKDEDDARAELTDFYNSRIL